MLDDPFAQDNNQGTKDRKNDKIGSRGNQSGFVFSGL